MPTNKKPSAALLSPADSSADFERALAAIDASFEKTMAELERLHQKKMALVASYKKAQDADQLSKIRKELNKTA